MSSSPFSTNRTSLISRPSSSASWVSRRSSASSSAIKMVIGMEVLFMSFLRKLFHRQRHDERRSVSFGTFSDDASAVAISNFAADREPDPGALEFDPGVQPLEDHENLLGEFRVKADAVILNGDLAN